MIDNQERNTVFLKPLITSPKIEIGEYTYYNTYNDADAATAFETRNVLYTAGPEKLIIGRFCAIASGARFLLSSANHPMLGSTAFPFFVFGGDWLELTADLLPRIPSRGDTVIRTGPRSSALVYLYLGLRSGASADDVLARAEADGAPFSEAEPLKAWVREALAELS